MIVANTEKLSRGEIEPLTVRQFRMRLFELLREVLDALYVSESKGVLHISLQRLGLLSTTRTQYRVGMKRVNSR